VTVVGALLLSPFLTPLTTRAAPSWAFSWLAPLVWPLLAGLVIALAGFLGDLNMSAVQRDAGVKDSSRALPGMGGVLDRIDSLTLTAPVFYWLIVVPSS
jgi:phosphatidate cytidylyltransferase